MTIGILVLGLLLWPSPAQAYLDPGSGSMLTQLLVAGLAGVIVGLKVFWKRIVFYFKSKK